MFYCITRSSILIIIGTDLKDLNYPDKLSIFAAH